MESLSPAFLEGAGVVTVVLLVGWMLATGRLVTRRELERAEHDRDEWRTESRIKDQELQAKNEQLAHLAEVGKSMHAVLAALKSGPPQGGAA